jgi:hypothetical protein
MPASAIRSMDYDPASTCLDVWFVTGGHYRFHQVPPELAQRFRSAMAKGWFFNTRIRGRFPFEELEREDKARRPTHH